MYQGNYDVLCRYRGLIRILSSSASRKQNRNPASAVTILRGGATEQPNCKPTKCLQFGNEERPLLSRWARLRGHLTSKGHF